MYVRSVCLLFMLLMLPGLQLIDPDSNEGEEPPESPPSSPDVTIRRHPSTSSDSSQVTAVTTRYPPSQDVVRIQSPVPDPTTIGGKLE